MKRQHTICLDTSINTIANMFQFSKTTYSPYNIFNGINGFLDMQNLVLDTKFIVHCSKFIVWRYGKNQSVVAILDYISKIKIYRLDIIFDDINRFLDPQNLLLHTKLTVLCTTVMELWEKISQRRPSWISQKLPGCCNDTLDFLELLVVLY